MQNIIKKENTRNEYIDIVKGFAIFLMVLGHCIINGSGAAFFNQGLAWKDPIFKFIYTFHMPLFMLISGYLLFFSLRSKSVKKFTIDKIKYLLIPIVVFNIYCYVFKFSFTHYNEVNILFYINRIIYQILDGYWFLWGILIWSVFIALSQNILSKQASKQASKQYITF